MQVPIAEPSTSAAGSAPSRWRGELQVEIERRGLRSAVVARRHEGPLALQRALYPERDGTPHLHLLHPPGGLVGGDALAVTIAVGAGASALWTTPAATKVYRARPGALPAEQVVTLRVREEASCEWLPGETIVFAGAHARLVTRADLTEHGRFIGWELVCLGRPACNEEFTNGSCELRLEVSRAGRPLVLERARLGAGERVLTERWGMNGCPVTGTMIASPAAAGEQALEELRAIAAALPRSDLASVTNVEGATVCRYLGTSVDRARSLFVALWSHLRPVVLGRPAVPPRIWST